MSGEFKITETSGILYHRKDEKSGETFWRLKRLKKNGEEFEDKIQPDVFSSDIHVDPGSSLNVEFQIRSGKVIEVRKQGGKYIPKQSANSVSPTNTRRRSDGNQSGKTWKNTKGGGGQKQQASPDFHNPYNFIPIPEYKEAAGLKRGAPAGHGSWKPEMISGTLKVKLTAETPLLLLDTRAPRYDGEHAIFDIRTNEEGKPILSPTALKGPLRTTFEAVTNSRFGVFKNEAPLGRRMNPKEGLAMIPARVKNDHELELLMGFEGPQLGKSWKNYSPMWFKPDNGGSLYKQKQNIDSKGKSLKTDTMYAAWLPSYRSPFDIPNYPDGKKPQHKDKVGCIIEKIAHGMFDYWVVRAIAKSSDTAECYSLRNKNLEKMNDLIPRNGTRNHKPTGFRKYVEGYVFISHENIRRKHDERVFFSFDLNHAPVVAMPNDPKIWSKSNWNDLIEDYSAVNKKEFDKRRKQGTDRKFHSGNPAFSRHITDKDKYLNLKAGDLCYAKVDENGQKIIGLYPVMISRELAAPDASPEKLAMGENPSTGHTPATKMDELSPADQVFGWVHQRKSDGASKSREAYKGQLRIADVSAGDRAIEKFNEPLPLAILSTPKPNQALFYAEKKGGEGYGARGEPPGTYQPGMRLRGRKVYPHQASLPDDYWSDPSKNWGKGNAHSDSDKTLSKGRVREYLRAAMDDGGNRRDNQNRSVTGWVAPGTVFTAAIPFENLTPEQLGALLYICTQAGCLKVGAAKPLGFGSVTIEVEALEGANGAEIKMAFGTFGPDSPFTRDIADRKDTYINAFKASISDAYGESFARVPFIKTFEAAHAGFADGLPVHYPRPGTPPNSRPYSAENFKWFMENKKRTGWLPQMGEGGSPYLGVATLNQNTGGGDDRSGGHRGGGRRNHRR